MVQAAKTPEVRSSTHERRRSYRQNLIVKAMLYRDDNVAAPQRVRLRNVSMGGVGFESPVPVDKGKYCRLILELGPARLNWRVKIVCCGKMGETDYILGGQFVTNEIDPMNRSDSDSGAESMHIGRSTDR